MTGDIEIILADGTYQLDTTFALTSQDSGTNGYSVIYKAGSGANPIISGGQTITGWTLHDSIKNIYRANVGIELQTRQLYINGVRAIRARGQSNPSGWSKTATGYTAPAGMSGWVT